MKDAKIDILKWVCKFYGKILDYDYLNEKFTTCPYDDIILGISDVSEYLGFRSSFDDVEIDFLKRKDFDKPIILFDGETLLGVIKKGNSLIVLEDKIEKKILWNEFKNILNFNSKISLLSLEPSPIFFSGKQKRPNNIRFLIDYFKPFKKYFSQLGLGVFILTFLQIIAPFLTQLLIDKGVNGKDLDLINVIIIALIVLHLSKLISEFIRGWIYLHVSTRINISIVSDFLIKILKLPLGFFNTRSVGDIMQRIEDQKRIETFLTKSLINTFFSSLTFIVYSVILFIYDLKIFLIFFILSLVYITWNLFFLKLRKKMDYNIFKIVAKGKNLIMQTVQSIQDIKLENIEKEQRWKWERNEVKLFKEKTKVLYVEQANSIGSVFINELKNILILYLSAVAVVNGNITLGTLVAIQYIIGQTNRSILDFSTFILQYQMALISVKRLMDIHDNNNENEKINEVITSLPKDKSIEFNKVNFAYTASGKMIFGLNNVSITIPENKVTAIIGESGSGKTTIVKMILKFHNPYRGKISIGGMNLKNIDTRWWRSQCGVILQDTVLFNKSILRNIVGETKEIDMERLLYALNVTNIHSYIDSLPNGLKTIVNYNGKGFSAGQKQRILLARIVYKNPKFVILDEATNSLDIRNEQKILSNLKEFFKNKTVLIITHKLSRVFEADNIVVINRGRVLEQGSHEDLINSNQENIYKNMIRERQNL